MVAMNSSSRENLLIAALPPALAAKVLHETIEVKLDIQQVVIEAGREFDSVYFPTSSVISIMTQVSDGQSTETAVVGFEGVSAFSIFRGTKNTSMKGIVQVGGNARRLSRERFIEYLGDGDFREVMLRYWEAALAFASQSVACQAFHPIEQRLSRWLLLVDDRIESTELPLTQEFLATMLGVQRPTVTLAARLLQASGFIRYRYGKIEIIDRPGLMAASCECYEAVADAFGMPPKVLRR